MCVDSVTQSVTSDSVSLVGVVQSRIDYRYVQQEVMLGVADADVPFFPQGVIGQVVFFEVHVDVTIGPINDWVEFYAAVLEF